MTSSSPERFSVFSVPEIHTSSKSYVSVNSKRYHPSPPGNPGHLTTIFVGGGWGRDLTRARHLT